MSLKSKDWRSPGDKWVKTKIGWEQLKTLECTFEIQQDSRCPELASFSAELRFSEAISTSGWVDEDGNVQHKHVVQPHCHITIRCTREIAGFNRLSDALNRLDFKNAVHDARRFKYICKLLDLLVSHNLINLSGCAQKLLFNMLEEVACHIHESRQNIHLLHKLLNHLKEMKSLACWGRPLGSTQLWETHLMTINRILSIANSIDLSDNSQEDCVKLENLPEECLREILRRLVDHKDLESSGEAYSVLKRLVNEQRIWRELCQFHFTSHQIECMRKKYQDEGKNTDTDVDWKKMYHDLRKRFGLREDYAEILELCLNCCCLYWQNSGHPCIVNQDPEFMEKLEHVDKSTLHIPVLPQTFLNYFSL